MVIPTNNIFKIQLKPKNKISYKSFDWSFFDKVFCIHYVNYRDREEELTKQLENIGVLDKPNFEYVKTYRNPYYLEILKSDKIDKKSINTNNIFYTIDSLNLMLRCQNENYKRILILEDDIRLLDDKNIIFNFLNNIPEDFDIINFDQFFYSNSVEGKRKIQALYKDLQKQFSIGKYFYPVEQDLDFSIYNTSMIALSDRQISRIINDNMRMLKPFDHYMKASALDNIKMYISTINLCHQIEYENRMGLDCTNKYKNDIRTI